MKPTLHELTFGLWFCVAGLLWMLVEKLAGWHGERIADHPVMTMLFMPIAIAVYVVAMRKKRARLGGTMTYGQGFASGMWISVVVAALSPLSQWLTHRVISPEYFPNAIRYAVDHDLLTQKEAEAYFSLPSYVVQSFVGALVAGLVTSAIVAIFARRS